MLVKKKVTTKYNPPDSGALKTYLDLVGNQSFEEMSDEELKREKLRLLQELQEENKKKKRGER